MVSDSSVELSNHRDKEFGCDLEEKQRAMSGLNARYFEKGCTEVMRLLSAADLTEIHSEIFSFTRHLYAESILDVPFDQRWSEPLVQDPSEKDLSELIDGIEQSETMRAILEHQKIREAFEYLFQSSVSEFPICRFRAQFPSVQKTLYDWHQDEGTWFAVPMKELAYQMPATLWLSLTGANENNSIEIIEESHISRLFRHTVKKHQGYFSAKLPSNIRCLSKKKVVSLPGEGVFFHPLTVHRSLKNPVNVPRYSLDIRYCSTKQCEIAYKTDWRFRLKRLFA